MTCSKALRTKEVPLTSWLAAPSRDARAQACDFDTGSGGSFPSNCEADQKTLVLK